MTAVGAGVVVVAIALGAVALLWIMGRLSRMGRREEHRVGPAADAWPKEP